MFIRIRTINGRTYRYLEERYREDGRVRSRSTYLGPAGGTSSGDGGGGGLLSAIADFIRPVPPEERGLRYIDKLVEKYPGDPFATKAAEMAAARPTAPPTPIEKAPSSIDLSAPAAPPEVAPEAAEAEKGD